MTDDRLNKLYPSSANVRKTGAKDGIEGLAQSIHNHGLLNNLAVQPGGEKETFSVLAGGRRLAALNHLAKAKLIPADWGVPRNVTEIEIEGDIPSGEISLAENEMRAAMRRKLSGMKKGSMAKAAERLLKGKGWLPAVLRGAK